jgi:hypothetical protein
LSTIPKTKRHALPELLRSPSLPALLIISAMAIGGAGIVPLVGSSIATSTNGNVHRLEQDLADWQARVQERELEVATMAGLDRIETVAKNDLRMVEPKKTRYIAVPAPPPEERRLPSRYLPPSPEERESEPALWERVLDWLPLP